MYKYKPEMQPKDGNDLYFNDINRNIRRDYQSVVNAHFGGQLQLGSITLRGGYAMQPDPRPTEILDRSKEYYSAGIGFTFQKFLSIDLGWTREMFDDRYQPAYYEDADYCVRVWKAGKRVVYNPRALVTHVEFASSASASAAVAMQLERRAVFVQTHEEWLAGQMLREIWAGA